MTERAAVQALIDAAWEGRPYVVDASRGLSQRLPSLVHLDAALRDLVENHGYSHGEWADIAEEVLG